MDKEEIINNVFPKIIAIHLTSYFPKKLIIKTRYYTRPSTWLRDTIHFTLNDTAGDLSAFSAANGRPASWSNSKFVILIPFNLLFQINGNNLQSFSDEDTFFIGNIIIPEGSTIITMPSGIEELIENNIITKEEIARSLKNVKDTGYITKEYNKINFKIFLPINKKKYKIKDLVNLEIQNLGYQRELLRKLNFRAISDTLNLPGGSHYTHWSSDLEDFGQSILAFEEEINNFLSLIFRLRSQGYYFPIIKEELGSKIILTAYDSEGKYFDYNNKLFDARLILSFPKNEQISLEMFRDSFYNDEHSRFRLQSPFIEAIRLKKIIPKEYHRDITLWIERHKSNIRKIPSLLITMCPELIKLLKQEY